MKFTLLVLVLPILFFSCKDVEKVTTETAGKKVVKKASKSNLPIKEGLFLTMERTPCFGKCPTYKISIFNTGRVLYEGHSNTKRIGNYSKNLTQNQLKEIEKMIMDIKLMEMKSVYDSEVTDLPSTHLFVVSNNQKKKILDRVDAPKQLKQFEKLVDFLVLDDELKQLERNK